MFASQIFYGEIYGLKQKNRFNIENGLFVGELPNQQFEYPFPFISRQAFLMQIYI
jgi:hypothetical protein